MILTDRRGDASDVADPDPRRAVPGVWRYAIGAVLFLSLLGAYEACELYALRFIAWEIHFIKVSDGSLLVSRVPPPVLLSIAYAFPRTRMLLRGILFLLALAGLARWLHAVRSRLAHVSDVDGRPGGSLPIRARPHALLAVFHPRAVVNEIFAQIPARRPTGAASPWLRHLMLLCWMLWGGFLVFSAASFALTYLLDYPDATAHVTSWERLLLTDHAAVALGVLGAVATVVCVIGVTRLVAAASRAIASEPLG
jgi:hypothetical protein